MRGVSAVVLVASLLAAGSIPATAQQFFGDGQSFFVHGSDPIDRRTQGQVDAYIDHLEILEEEEAQRERDLETFIYQDRTHSPLQDRF